MNDEGHELVSIFADSGLLIYDKTPYVGYIERAQEIRQWLFENNDVERFVIFDDNSFGWGDLSDNFVQTNYRIGRGLEEEHIEKALEILN